MKRITVSAAALEKAYTKDGTPVLDICHEFGISKPTLYYLLDKMGIPRRVPRESEFPVTRVKLVD